MVTSPDSLQAGLTPYKHRISFTIHNYKLNMRHILSLLLLALSLGASSSLGAQAFRTNASLFGAIRARHIGPAVMSGRVSSLAVAPGQPEVIYVGSAGGGVWKSISGGTTFRPIFDDHCQSIGKIAIAPSNADIVWVGTGEPWPRNSVAVGDGVYKSVNGGSEWKNMGLAATERIADIIIHPTNPDVVYVAALGPLWSAGADRGVYKTTDGGASWNKIFYIDENTGAADLSVDPANPDILYVTMWSFRRYPWFFDSGFTGTSALYKSTNGGGSWNKIHNGLPDEKLGRMAVAVAPSNSQVVYLSVECKSLDKRGIYLSEDAGNSWRKVNNDFNATARPFYFANLIVDPKNDSIVVKCGVQAIISENRAGTFRPFDGTVHSDMHDVWIDPANTKHLLVGTDGGMYESFDRGRTFRMWMNLPLSQFYHVSVDQEQPFNVYGGLQDNGSWYAPNRKAGGITNSDWQSSFGGDGFYSFRHPTNKNIIFSEYQGGNLVRYDKTTGQAKSIAPYPQAGEDKYRFNWNTPIHISPNKPERMYFASQYLFMSDNMGDSWRRISPDLTTNDPAKQRQFESGGLTIDNSTAENHCTIYSVAESPRDVNVIWAGTDDGQLHLTTNGGTSWANLTAKVPGLPAHTWVSYIEPSPHQAGTAFVTFDGHRTGDMKTYLYKTTDFGQTWTSLVTADLSGHAFCVRQDLVSAQLLFAGTETGLYVSIDGGASWARFTNNMPKVAVHDMVIHPRDHALVLATHGRGVIILDDISPLRQIQAELISKPVAFLAGQPTVLRDPGAGGAWFGGSADFVAPNPTSAAQVAYYMSKRHTFGQLYAEVYKNGTLLRTLAGGKSAGINLIEMPTSLKPPRSAPTKNRMALFGSLFGPNLEAGTYELKLIKGKDTFNTTFELMYDPQAPYTSAERKLQHETLTSLYNMSEQLAYIYDALEKIETEAKAVTGLKPKSQRLVTALADRIAKEQLELVSLEGDFYIDEQERIRELISTLYYKISTYPGAPSEPQILEARRLAAEMATIQQRFDALLATDLVAVNAELSRAQRPVISVPTKEAFLSEEATTGDTGGNGQGERQNFMYRYLMLNPAGNGWQRVW